VRSFSPSIAVTLSPFHDVLGVLNAGGDQLVSSGTLEERGRPKSQKVPQVIVSVLPGTVTGCPNRVGQSFDLSLQPTGISVAHPFGVRQLGVLLSAFSPSDFFSFSPTAGTTMFRPKSHADWTRIGEFLLIFFSLIGLAYFLFGPR
jgi:hypothetical protein